MKIIKEKWLLLITIILFLLILFTPIAQKYAFVPDYLNFSKLQSADDFFSLIIGAIASIFGILMAVIILSVEFFKEKLDKNNYLNPFDNHLIKNSIYLSVNIISFSFLSYIMIDKFNNSKYITIGYFIAALFVIYVYSVFPILKNIINSSSQIKQVLEMIKKLEIIDYKEFSKYSYKEKNPDSNLRKIKNEIDTYILENKINSYEVILEKILEKTIKLIGDGSNRENCDILIDALTWLLGENCKTAIRVNDSKYFDCVWNSINSIYLFAADKKIELINLQELESFIYFDIKNLYKHFKNTISLGNALNVIENSFNANITKNCPKQEDIWELINLYEKNHHTDSNFTTSFNWNHIITIIDFIFDIQDISIELIDKDLFEECNHRINKMCFNIIFKFDNLGQYQKGYLIWQKITKSYYKSSVALERGLYFNTLDCYNIHENLLKTIIQNEILKEEDIRVILKTLGNYLFTDMKNKKLNSDYTYGTFGNFCRIGINSIKKYKMSTLNKNVVDYFINYFTNLKFFIEKEGIENYVNEYTSIKSAISHFINVYQNFEVLKLDDEQVKKWTEILNDFKDIPIDSNFNIDWKIK